MKQERTIAIYKEERVWFFVAVGVFFASIALYTYFLSASVMHVVMRKELNQELRQVASEISNYEAEYIELQHEVSADIASLQGYVVAERKIFIDRTEDILVLRERTGG